MKVVLIIIYIITELALVPRCLFAFDFNNATKQQYQNRKKDPMNVNSALLALNRSGEVAYLNLIHTYHQNGKDEIAIAYAFNFLKTYPFSSYCAYVHYMIGVLICEVNCNFIYDFLDCDSQRDPHNFFKAFQELRLSILHDRQAFFSQDAKKRMMYVNHVIAQREYNVAVYYFDHNAYNASMNRAKTVIEYYSNSDSAQYAFILTLRIYHALGK